MVSVKLALGGVTAAIALAVAQPAQAVITTFANYSAIGSGSNLYWKNDGTDGLTNGTGGELYTISSGSSTTKGSVLINFSFLQAALAPFVSNVTASFTLDAKVADTPTDPALKDLGFEVQPDITSIAFSILSTSAININGRVYAAGSNLLSGSFDQGSIFGGEGSSSGSVSAATTDGATITYSSDFLNFDSTADRDLSLSLTSITPSLTSADGKALWTFKALSTGSFSADPAPSITAPVPEPASWAMFLGGFGLMGAALRRRRPAQGLA